MSSNYGWGLPVAASSYAKDVDRALYLLHASMITVFLVFAGVMAYLLIRYRARPGVRAESNPGRWWWLALPLVLIFADELLMIFRVALPTWRKIAMERPHESQANVIEVVAEQYAWNVHYPGPDGLFGRRGPGHIDSANVLGLDPQDPAGKDDVVTLNELRLPVGRPTLAYLSSKDVIHSFFIPEFRIKKDAVPGMRIPIWFEPVKEGRYELACSQLCGIGHSSMRADVIAEAPGAFQAWLKSQARTGS